LEFLVANRFNAVRVPFTAELALDLDAAQPAQSAINFTENGILEVNPEEFCSYLPIICLLPSGSVLMQSLRILND